MPLNLKHLLLYNRIEWANATAATDACGPSLLFLMKGWISVVMGFSSAFNLGLDKYYERLVAGVVSFRLILTTVGG